MWTEFICVLLCTRQWTFGLRKCRAERVSVSAKPNPLQGPVLPTAQAVSMSLASRCSEQKANESRRQYRGQWTRAAACKRPALSFMDYKTAQHPLRLFTGAQLGNLTLKLRTETRANWGSARRRTTRLLVPASAVLRPPQNAVGADFENIAILFCIHRALTSHRQTLKDSKPSLILINWGGGSCKFAKGSFKRQRN